MRILYSLFLNVRSTESRKKRLMRLTQSNILDTLQTIIFIDNLLGV
jgi:hypothetical protein